MRPLLRLAAIAAALAFAAGVSPVSAQSQPVRITGIVDSFAGQTLVVASPGGDKATVTVPASVTVTALVNMSLADIKPGDFVGSAAVEGKDGKLHAQEVHIFPESMRGMREGHRPMSEPGQSMTNATVSEVIAAPDGRTLKLKYRGGEQDIEVAPGARIVGIVAADRSLLKPGAAVSVFALKGDDGTLTARFVQAEKDGVKPL
jgi:hypothetical protein